jgi:hypothetical protein
VLPVLLKLLPIALGMALSTVPITATLLILLSPRRRQSSLPFLIGWLLGLTAVTVAFAEGALALPISPRRRQATAIAIAELVVGAALIALAVVTWLRRARPRQPRPWLKRIESVGPVPAFGIAFILALRPKSLLLSAAAGLVLAGQHLRAGETSLAIGCYVVLSSTTVAVPIVLTLIAPKRMEPRLRSWQAWLSTNGPVITSIVVLLIGVVVLVTGITTLL